MAYKFARGAYIMSGSGGASGALTVEGDLSCSVNMSASYYYGDGSQLENVASDKIKTTLGSANSSFYVPFVDQATAATNEDIYIADTLSLNPSTDLITTAGALTATGILKTDNTTDATTNADGSLQTDGGLSVAKAIFNSTAATLAAASGVVTIGSSTAAVFSDGGALAVNNATDSTAGTNGSLQTDGGLGVVKDIIAGNDVKLLSDSAVLALGLGSDATFTHDGTTGLTIAATPISINSTGDLTLDSTTDIVFDAAGGNFEFKDAGTTQLTLDVDTTDGDIIFKLGVDSDDLVFQQFDGTAVMSITDDNHVVVHGGLVPDADNGAYLGEAGTAFSDLFLAEGGVINWDSGDVTMTQTGDVLAVAGGNLRAIRLEIDGANDYIDVSTDLQIVAAADILLDPAGGDVKVDGNMLPNADNTSDLGSAALAWQDLFLEGDVTFSDAGSITTSAGALTVAPTGDLIISSDVDVNAAMDISGDLTLSAGGDGALRFSAASSIKILDGNAVSLVIEEGDNAYMTFDTADNLEKVSVNQEFLTSGSLRVCGGLRYDGMTVITGTNYMVTDDNSYYIVSGTAACSLYLPGQPNPGDWFGFKRHSKNENNVTILSASAGGGASVDGVDTLVLETAGAAVQCLYDGSTDQWHIF